MKNGTITIRHAETKDLEALSDLEHTCFPEAEACGTEQMKQRLETYPDCFFIHEEKGKIVSFVDGLLSSDNDLKDEMYENVHLHDPDGTWLMILGVASDPEFRGRHYASGCLQAALQQCRAEQKYGAVLTCKENLIPFYEKNGFLSEGISESVHGNVTWYQMRNVPAPEKIETEHLVLRKAEEKDAAALYAHILSHKESSRYMTWETCRNLPESRPWLKGFRKESEQSGKMLYLVDEKDGDACIGFAGFGYKGMRIYEEQGIALGPQWCGKGYGGEILDAFLEYALEKFGGRKFVYSCLKDNEPSIRLVRSRGFALCREDLLYFEKDDRNHPHLVFELDGKEYRP